MKIMLFFIVYSAIFVVTQTKAVIRFTRENAIDTKTWYALPRASTTTIIAAGIMPDGETIVIANSHQAIYSYNIKNRPPFFLFDYLPGVGITATVKNFIITPDKKYIGVCAEEDEPLIGKLMTIAVWDVANKQIVQPSFLEKLIEQQQTMQTLGITACGFHHENKFIASLKNRTLLLITYDNVTTIKSPNNSIIKKIEISPSDKHILAASDNNKVFLSNSDQPFAPDKFIQLPFNKQIRNTCLTNSAIIIDFQDNTLEIWSYQGTLLHTFNNVPHQINTLAVMPNDTYVVAGNADGYIHVIDTANFTIYSPTDAQKSHQGAITSILFTPDNQKVITTGVDGKIIISNITETNSKEPNNQLQKLLENLSSDLLYLTQLIS
ncbi:MAG: hypothetical protein WC707_03420 [Candidatus Babeliaceae bacterium]|jgi:WD40 repeat protein